MKTKSSGAEVMFMKRRTAEPELCHFLRRLRSREKIHTVAGHVDDPE